MNVLINDIIAVVGIRTLGMRSIAPWLINYNVVQVDIDSTSAFVQI